MKKKISKAMLKKAIIAAEAERTKYAVVPGPDRAQRSILQKNRRASEKMVSKTLMNAGLDMKKFQALQEQRDVELERVVARHKADALRRVSRRKDAINRSIVEQGKAFGGLVSRQGNSIPHPSFASFCLNKPFLIWTMPLMSLSDSATEPFNSWVRFKFSTSQSRGTQKVSFYFYWVNPFSEYAVINASTILVASGFLKAHAHRPGIFQTSGSFVQAKALFGLGLGLPRDVPSTSYATESLGQTGALGWFLTGGDTNDTTFDHIKSSLSKTMFAVPPGEVVVFEVALAIDYENDEGNIEADFGGGFRIICPDVVFSLSSLPPGIIV